MKTKKLNLTYLYFELSETKLDNFLAIYFFQFTQLYTGKEAAEKRVSELESELEELRRNFMAARNIAIGLQEQLEHSEKTSVSALATKQELSTKVVESELKLKDALNEVGIVEMVLVLFIYFIEGIVFLKNFLF